MNSSKIKWQRIKYLPSIPLGEDGTRVTSSPKHIALSRRAAAEGMVLLKNNEELLPLKKGSRIALFGKASADYVKGGGGSGDVTVSYVHSIIDGFEEKEAEGRVSLFHPLCDFYKQNVAEQYAEKVQCGYTKEPELLDALLKKARKAADIAIISICRFSAEGWDRKGEPNDADFYLSLEEQAMISKVESAFDRIILVLNVGGMVDSSWFKNNDKIQSVLLAWQAGMEGGKAEADVLCGDECPSGKLTDTFASSFDDYPSSYNFNEALDHYDPAHDIIVPSSAVTHLHEDYCNYTDDIYVGYRYFETIPGAKEKVNYPFGFGLSYTTFDVKHLKTQLKNGVITMQVRVQNTGAYAGKEVLQVYVKAPMGKLGKPSASLVAFKKTSLLEPKANETLTLTFKVTDMASFDDTGLVQKSAFVLEAGDYEISLGTSVANRSVVYKYSVKETQIVYQSKSLCAPHKLPERLRADGTCEKLSVTDYPVIDKHPEYPQVERQWALVHTQPDMHGVKIPQGRISLQDVAQGKATLDEFLDGMSNEDMIVQLGGQPNTGVANTWGFCGNDSYGIPSAMTADGPAGVRITPQVGVVCTAWPCATLLACTWNEDLVTEVGHAGGLELKENNLAIWLTPALNIHRTPLCGRNFEYYSEDPLISGKIAAALVRGIQSNGVGACAKHFCCNNRETNRLVSDSRVSERALREIYLRGFEICVKESQPLCIMTSYNQMNGRYTSENKELLTDILRGEWGFEGAVTTDWNNLAEHYYEVLAGNDIRMSVGHEVKLLKALEEGIITREDLRACVKRLMEMLLKLD